MYTYLLEKNNSLLHIIMELGLFYYFYFRKKDTNIWIFGAIRGQKYMDNSQFLFEYVCKHTSVRAIWISKNIEVIDTLKSRGYEAYYEYSAEGLDFASRAQIAVITHRSNRSTADLPFYVFNKHTKIIQLWHGIPLKKIAYDDTIFSHKNNENSYMYKFKNSIKSIIFPFLDYVNKPSLILSLSNESKMLFSKAFRVRDEQVIISGYPRNDKLFQIIDIKKKKKKIIYMPTFRGELESKHDLFLAYGFDIKKFDLFLEKENLELHVKTHAFNKPHESILCEFEKSKNIIIIDEDDIYKKLASYDMLLTDYSSVYFDYLLLDKPIIFTPFDKETYIQKDREFYFNYDDVTPGPKANNWNEVIESISQFIKDPSLYSTERNLIKNRFHKYQDAQSSERVYEAIVDILE